MRTSHDAHRRSTLISARWWVRPGRLFTAVYQYEIRGGWTVQPNLQYILHPGGGATDPVGADPGRLLRNATVLGIRTTLKF